MEEFAHLIDSRPPEQIVQAHSLAVARYSAQNTAALSKMAAPFKSLSSILRDSLESLLLAKTLAERWTELVRCLAYVGADQINYGVFDLRQGGRERAPVRFLTTMDSGWLDYYTLHRLDLSDSHAIAARANQLLPYAWGESGKALLANASQQQTQQFSNEAGLRASLCIPLHDPLAPEKAAGSITIGSSSSEETFFAGLQGRWGDLVALAQTFHHLSQGELRQQELGNKTLSAREVECLSLIASGLRLEGIGTALNLARSTVDLHLRNARHKLGAVTLAEAVGRALATHQIALH